MVRHGRMPANCPHMGTPSTSIHNCPIMYMSGGSAYGSNWGVQSGEILINFYHVVLTTMRSLSILLHRAQAVLVWCMLLEPWRTAWSTFSSPPGLENARHLGVHPKLFWRVTVAVLLIFERGNPEIRGFLEQFLTSWWVEGNKAIGKDSVFSCKSKFGSGVHNFAVPPY